MRSTRMILRHRPWSTNLCSILRDCTWYKQDFSCLAMNFALIRMSLVDVVVISITITDIIKRSIQYLCHHTMTAGADIILFIIMKNKRWVLG